MPDNETTYSSDYRNDEEFPFVVADPHIVDFDAVFTSPWNQKDQKTLPNRDDWSTYRCASKDIIIGSVTHRYNRQMHRLDVRAYFNGEHPIYCDLEPTRILLIVLLSQVYQAGGSLELFFEQGLPLDVRELIERRLGVIISGHEKILRPELAKKLYLSLSDLPPELFNRIEAELPGETEKVCFSTFRGTWSSNQIKTLIQRGVPLRYIFSTRPSPLRNPAIYSHLLDHIRAVLMEDFAIHRLANRTWGVNNGKQILRTDTKYGAYYLCSDTLYISDTHTTSLIENDSFVDIAASTQFCLVPVNMHSMVTIMQNLGDIVKQAEKSTLGHPVIVVPLDFIYLNNDQEKSLRKKFKTTVKGVGGSLLVVGMTMAQLLTEAERNLAMTSVQEGDEEGEMDYVDRYPD